MKIRMRVAVGQAAARAFLIRHNSLWAAYLGELVHPLDPSGARRRDLYWSKTLLSLLTWCFMVTAGTR